MKAAVVTRPGDVESTTADDPAPGPREMVVEGAACGLCGTALPILQGEFTPKLPIVPGHDLAGEVVAVGSAVVELAVGARVAVDPSPYRLECAVRGYDVLRSRRAFRVLVHSAETMGLTALQLAKATGAASVDVVDINAEHLAPAGQLGRAAALVADAIARFPADIGRTVQIQPGLVSS